MPRGPPVRTALKQHQLAPTLIKRDANSLAQFKSISGIDFEAMARRLAMCESVTGKAMETQPMQPMGSPMFFDVTNILDIRFLFPFPIGSELLDAI